MTAAPPFRWAVIGTGAVSARFVHGLAALQGRAQVTRVLSRREDSARAFAAAFGIPEARAGVTPQALEGVDAVYVASPVSEHATHALAAIAAGRPVLVEKPFAMTAAEAATVAAAAEAAGVFCMEALWTRFLPLLALMRAQIAAGALGQVTGFDGSFQIATRPDPGSSLFDPARGGGALLQRGVYPLSLACHLLGPVVRVQSAGRIGPTGVDEDCALLLTHATGAISTIRASLTSDGPNGMTITGTKASLHVAPPVWRPVTARLVSARPGTAGGGVIKAGRLAALRETGPAQRLLQGLGPLKARLTGRAGTRLHAPFAGNGYGHEAEEVMACVAAGRTESAVMPLSETLAIMALIDAALAGMQEMGPT
jgi:predicted dehydrogenase